MGKDNFYIISRATESKIKTVFTPALNGRGYEIALVGLSTYYSYPNVDETSNGIDIIDDKGTKHEIRLPTGCYELRELIRWC